MISFTPLSYPPTEDNIFFLYKLLLERRYSISHNQTPSFEGHREFVVNHPYRFWSIVEVGGRPIGAVYAGFDNSVGIQLLPQSLVHRPAVIRAFLQKHCPLPAKASLVSGDFVFNVAVADTEYQNDLRECGAFPLQMTFVLKNIESE